MKTNLKYTKEYSTFAVERFLVYFIFAILFLFPAFIQAQHNSPEFSNEKESIQISVSPGATIYNANEIHQATIIESKGNHEEKIYFVNNITVTNTDEINNAKIVSVQTKIRDKQLSKIAFKSNAQKAIRLKAIKNSIHFVPAQSDVAFSLSNKNTKVSIVPVFKTVLKFGIVKNFTKTFIVFTKNKSFSFLFIILLISYLGISYRNRPPPTLCFYNNSSLF